MMIRPEPEIDVQKWTNAPQHDSSQLLHRNPMNIFSQSSQNVIHKSQTFKKPCLTNVLNSKSAIFNSPQQTKTSVSTRKFPVEPILHEIACNMISTFPQLTLKNDAMMEYTEAATDLVKKALVANINKSLEQETSQKTTISNLKIPRTVSF